MEQKDEMMMAVCSECVGVSGEAFKTEREKDMRREMRKDERQRNGTSL